MADTDFDKRVHILEARAAITDLVHRYALHIRRGAQPACTELFTEDGAFIIRQFDPASGAEPTVFAENIGRAAVAAYIAGSGKGDLRVFPMIRNLLIEVDGSTAIATSLMSSRTWPAGAEVFGEYQDSFREEGGVWLFTRRIFTIHRRSA